MGQSQFSFGSHGIHLSVLRLDVIPSPPYLSFRNLLPCRPGFPLRPGEGQPGLAHVSSLVAAEG